MIPLNIVDSLYSGREYKESLNSRLVKKDLDFNEYLLSRFPSNSSSFEPYKLDFQRYCDILSRVKVNVSLPAPVTLNLNSCKSHWDFVITAYSEGTGTVSEPLWINNTDLFYNYEDYRSSYLTPLGILAFLFRKSYGNEKFRQYINSSILKEEYYKISSKNSPTFYIHKECKANMGIIKEIGELFKLERWRIIGDLLVMSPYIFSWRD